jgi:hypothetical protein
MKDSTVIDVVRNEPLKNQRLDPRDERATRLRDMVRDFVTQSFALLSDVRQDFLDKGRDEKILDCSTWKEYCEKVLGYSESHIRNMMAKFGSNPGKKFAATKPYKKSNDRPEGGAKSQHAVEKNVRCERGFSDGRNAGVKSADLVARKQSKSIKGALGIPLHDVLPLDVEAAYETGYDKGYEVGCADGAEAQFQYDIERAECEYKSTSSPITEEDRVTVSETLSNNYHIIRRISDGRFFVNGYFLDDSFGIHDAWRLETEFEDETHEKRVGKAFRLARRRNKEFKSEDCQVINVEVTYTLTPLSAGKAARP